MAIILVVIGHATGLFNSYIYQFHVAAFFFISGWCAKIDKNSFLKDLYKKAMTLIVPLLSLVIIFGGITNLMNICGIYKYFCEDVDLISIGESVNNFVKTGSMMNLMGAAWFVVVLFSVSLLSHFLYIILFHNKYAFIIAARNENAVIGNLIDSIKNQNYPSELIDVIVVADNCTCLLYTSPSPRD